MGFEIYPLHQSFLLLLSGCFALHPFRAYNDGKDKFQGKIAVIENAIKGFACVILFSLMFSPIAAWIGTFTGAF
ncbi:MAG: hypothetical protein CVU57_17735 [Deltaproteobacteria bacterium HGW-Deltaproteobacteria-15]|jgi:ABC-type microcin C transport system permease subunit YejE|nr:MAG: hypothetical protein CVU57_17735 [Deltaproteobacteria bacterium HGW-Deltaproteobacteria-15]